MCKEIVGARFIETKKVNKRTKKKHMNKENKNMKKGLRSRRYAAEMSEWSQSFLSAARRVGLSPHQVFLKSLQAYVSEFDPATRKGMFQA